MTYCKKFIQCVLEFHDKGNSERQTCELFDIGTTTLKRWKKMRDLNGAVILKGTRNVKPTVYPSAELHAFIKANPLSIGREIAAHFGGSTNGAYDALKREGITLKP
jgi:transposase